MTGLVSMLVTLLLFMHPVLVLKIAYLETDYHLSLICQVLDFILLVSQDYHTLCEQGSQHILLDVREEVEYGICRLDNSHSNFPNSV